MPKDHLKHPRHVAVALNFAEETHKLLMVTSRKHPNLWILPKGGVEAGETSGRAAVRESWEEAGTPRSLRPPTDDEELLTLDLHSSSKHKRSSLWHVHLLKVPRDGLEPADDWPEKAERRREWVTPREALRRIQEWYTDHSLLTEEGDGALEAEGGASHAAGKMDKKGGAMEQALRAFIEIKGWGNE